jgi:hypothetical protein
MLVVVLMIAVLTGVRWSLSVHLSNVCMFLLLFLLLISSFNALWSDRMYGIISIFLHQLRLALCPKI